jgi:hypothetical protein
VIGPNDRSLSRMGIIKALLCDPSLRNIQVHCFCALLSMGYDGFHSLVDLAAKDYNSL